MTWLFWLIGILAFIGIICFLIYFVFMFQTNIAYVNGDVFVTVYIYNIKVFRKKLDIKVEDNGDDDDEPITKKIEKIKKYLQENFENIKIVLCKANQTITARTYSIIVNVGAGNNMMTGIAIGSVHAVVTIVQGLISEHIEIKEMPTVKVNPIMTEKKLDISGNVIVEYKIYKLMKLIKTAKKLLLKGDK